MASTPYTGYGARFGNIFDPMVEGGHPDQLLGDLDFGILGPSNFGNTKIKTKTKKCLDGSLPPCDEDVITTGDGRCKKYGKCPDGTCKNSAGDTCRGTVTTCDYGYYADGTCKPPHKTNCQYGVDALGNCLRPDLTPFNWEDVKHLTGPEFINPFDWRGEEAQWGTTEGQRIGRGSEVQRFGGLRPVGLTQDQQKEIDKATENYRAGILSQLSGTLGYTGETGNDFSQFDSIADVGREFLDVGDTLFDFDRAIASSDPLGVMSDVRTGEALETLRLQEQEDIENMVDSFSLLDVKETYKKAEDKLDNMADSGILSAAEVTTAKQTLQEEEKDVVKEVVEASTGGGGGGGDDRDDRGDEKKPDKPTKTRQSPHKTKTTKTKTKTVSSRESGFSKSRQASLAAARAATKAATGSTYKGPGKRGFTPPTKTTKTGRPPRRGPHG